MSDSYQAVYDATRSSLRNCDVGAAITEVARSSFDISYILPRALEVIGLVENELLRPSTRMRPRLFIDGNKWCALYGENLQDGVAGFGDTPDAACWDFDKAWQKPLSLKPLEDIAKGNSTDPILANFEGAVRDGLAAAADHAR